MDLEKVQAIRRERLAEAATRAGGKAALGRLLGYKDGAFVGQMLRGERPVTEETVAKLHSKHGFKDWFVRPLMGFARFQVEPSDSLDGPSESEQAQLDEADQAWLRNDRRSRLAHSLSEIFPTLDVTTVEWENLMKTGLPQAFSLVAKDDAMAPILMKGNTARFSTERISERVDLPGKKVLVADRDDHCYIREYRLRRGDHWQAVATNAAAGYDPLDSIADGLRVLAVMTGVDWE